MDFEIRRIQNGTISDSTMAMGIKRIIVTFDKMDNKQDGRVLRFKANIIEFDVDRNSAENRLD